MHEQAIRGGAEVEPGERLDMSELLRWRRSWRRHSLIRWRWRWRWRRLGVGGESGEAPGGPRRGGAVGARRSEWWLARPNRPRLAGAAPWGQPRLRSRVAYLATCDVALARCCQDLPSIGATGPSSRRGRCWCRRPQTHLGRAGPQQPLCVARDVTHVAGCVRNLSEAPSELTVERASLLTHGLADSRGFGQPRRVPS